MAKQSEAILASSKWGRQRFPGDNPCETFLERPNPKVFRLDHKMAVGADVTESFVQLNRCYTFGEGIG